MSEIDEYIKLQMDAIKEFYGMVEGDIENKLEVERKMRECHSCEHRDINDFCDAYGAPLFYPERINICPHLGKINDF